SLGGIASSPTQPLLAAANTESRCVILRRFDHPETPETRLPLEKVPGVCLFSPDGKRLVVACAEGDLLIWDTGHWSLPARSLKQGELPSCLAIDPASRLLASACLKEGVKIAELETGIWLFPAVPAPASINDLAFNFNGSLLAMACEDKTVQFWDVATRKVRR